MKGVFDELVNSKCFVDRVDMNVWGKPRNGVGAYIASQPSVGIASRQSQYARLGRGTSKLTGNPVQWKYGNFRNVAWGLPPYRFLMRSDKNIHLMSM